jgi:SAM-dependent MidA family methyltransferase
MAQPILPEPPEQLKRLSETLAGRIRTEIREQGMVPFSRYMERALYEPGLGYYSAGLHKLGAGGDFVTAPELGGLFAACLARQIAEVGTRLGSYDVLEIGAGTGSLAGRLLPLLGARHPPRRYLILETSGDLRRVQGDTIRAAAPDWLDLVGWLERPPEDDWSGLLLANEVIDALAVERFRLTAGEVEQVCVADTGSGFAWAYRPAPTDLRAAVDHIATSLYQPLGQNYRSEIQLTLAPWLSEITARLRRGLALFVDYGYPRREYYLPERRDGTLMCHYRHRAHGDVFFWPGLQDITAWVDFTALAEAADACGLEVLGYCSQAMFLLGCGLPEVLAEASAEDPGGSLSLGAEARQLTLPGMMGERFQVMALGRGLDGGADDAAPLSGFSLQDLRYRL